MPQIVASLDPAVEEQVRADFTDSAARLKAGDKAGAVHAALRGWQRMPVPVFGWDVSLSKVRVLVHILREAGEYAPAIEVLQGQLKSEFYQDHQYHPHFLLGTVYFAMDDMNAARDNFLRANDISGGRCFSGENPAYKKPLKA